MAVIEIGSRHVQSLLMATSGALPSDMAPWRPRAKYKDPGGRPVVPRCCLKFLID